MSFTKVRNFLVEPSKKSVRLEIVKAMARQNITVTHLVVDSDSPIYSDPQAASGFLYGDPGPQVINSL